MKPDGFSGHPKCVFLFLGRNVGKPSSSIASKCRLECFVTSSSCRMPTAHGILSLAETALCELAQWRRASFQWKIRGNRSVALVRCGRAGECTTDLTLNLMMSSERAEHWGERLGKLHCCFVIPPVFDAPPGMRNVDLKDCMRHNNDKTHQRKSALKPQKHIGFFCYLTTTTFFFFWKFSKPRSSDNILFAGGDEGYGFFFSASKGNLSFSACFSPKRQVRILSSQSDDALTSSGLKLAREPLSLTQKYGKENKENA